MTEILLVLNHVHLERYAVLNCPPIAFRFTQNSLIYHSLSRHTSVKFHNARNSTQISYCPVA